MEGQIYNYTGRLLIIFKSEHDFDPRRARNILKNKVKPLLDKLKGKNWLANLQNNNIETINDLTYKIRDVITELDFVSVLLPDDSHKLINYFSGLNYLVLFSIDVEDGNIVVNCSVANLKSMSNDSNEAANNFKIYLGNKNTFICDTQTINGDFVCPQQLDQFAKKLKTIMLNGYAETYSEPILEESEYPEIYVKYLFLNNFKTETVAESGDIFTYTVVVEDTKNKKIYIVIILLLIVLIIVGGYVIYYMFSNPYIKEVITEKQVNYV